MTVYPFQNLLPKAADCDPIVCLTHDRALTRGAPHHLEVDGTLALVHVDWRLPSLRRPAPDPDPVGRRGTPSPRPTP